MPSWLWSTFVWLKSLRGGPVSLGSANLALVSLYFAPVFGREAVQALLSPHRGLGERVQAAAIVPLGHWLNFGLDELTTASGVLAGLKLVIATGFVVYLIDFARALAVKR